MKAGGVNLFQRSKRRKAQDQLRANDRWAQTQGYVNHTSYKRLIRPRRRGLVMALA